MLTLRVRISLLITHTDILKENGGTFGRRVLMPHMKSSAVYAQCTRKPDACAQNGAAAAA